MNTGKVTTIARPYAIAAFEFATAENALLAWETMLQAASSVVQDASVQKLLSTPQVTSSELGEFVCGVLSTVLNEKQKNFIHLLAENNRLAFLPDIAALFKAYREEQEKMLTVKVASAIPLDEAYQGKLVQALTQQLHRKVTLECRVDEGLLGGVVVHAGDTVIDGSIRGKLNRLVEFIL